MTWGAENNNIIYIRSKKKIRIWIFNALRLINWIGVEKAALDAYCYNLKTRIELGAGKRSTIYSTTILIRMPNTLRASTYIDFIMMKWMTWLDGVIHLEYNFWKLEITSRTTLGHPLRITSCGSIYYTK